MMQQFLILSLICFVLIIAVGYFAGAYFRRRDFEKLYSKQSEVLAKLNATVINQYEQIRAMSAVIEEYRKIVKND